MGISTAVQRCMSPVTKSHEVLSRTRSHEPPNTEASQFLSLALVQYTPSPVEVIQPTVCLCFEGGRLLYRFCQGLYTVSNMGM